jgi:hypothetical protein
VVRARVRARPRRPSAALGGSFTLGYAGFAAAPVWPGGARCGARGLLLACTLMASGSERRQRGAQPRENCDATPMSYPAVRTLTHRRGPRLLAAVSPLGLSRTCNYRAGAWYYLVVLGITTIGRA